MDALAIAIRILHIGFALIAGGAAFYQWRAVLPALAGLDDVRRREIRAAMLQRWRGVIWTAMPVLLITGLMNYLMFKIPVYREHPHKALYHILFGVKFLAALGVFHSATVLSLPGEKFDRKYRDKAGFWLGFMLLMLAVVVVIGALLSNFERLF